MDEQTEYWLDITDMRDQGREELYPEEVFEVKYLIEQNEQSKLAKIQQVL